MDADRGPTFETTDGHGWTRMKGKEGKPGPVFLRSYPLFGPSVFICVHLWFQMSAPHRRPSAFIGGFKLPGRTAPTPPASAPRSRARGRGRKEGPAARTRVGVRRSRRCPPLLAGG